MSVIAVKGIPWKWSLKAVMKSLSGIIYGPFEVLNFKPGRLTLKTCYVRLSERLDPLRVVEKINRSIIGSGAGMKFVAFIPKVVPNIPLAKKPAKISKKKNKPKIYMDTPQEALKYTHQEVMTELQSKFPGLLNLSKKTSHKLLDEITRILFNRLKDIAQRNADARQNCFKLSKAYRKTHPHFGDFQLILTTLHRLQDEAGVPRTQVLESELASVPAQPNVTDELLFGKVQYACKKYMDRITKKILEHVKNLKTEISQIDGEEEIARKKVREELKKMTPFMSAMVRQVITKHFIPQKSDYIRMRIYGEPFLPTKDLMKPFILRYNSLPQNIYHSQKMYNMLVFSVPPKNFQSLVAMDGTVINGAKLVIRSSDLPRYKVPANLMKELMASCGYHETGESEVKCEVAEDWSEV